MKVVTLDTNVLISATFWSGASYKILKLIEEKKVILVLSPQILDEFTEVLEYEEIQEKIKDKNLEMKMTIAKLKELAKIFFPKKRVQVVSDDPDDNAVIECAIAGNADFVISNDKHLLKLKEYQGTYIVTPEEFLHSLFL